MANVPAAGLPLRATLPGIAVVVVFPLLSSTLPGEKLHLVSIAYPVLLIVIPWIAIFALGKGSGSLGFTRRRLTANLVWGVLLGTLWRGGTLLVNFVVIRLMPFQVTRWIGFETILLIPWMEEVFFRGYLGSALSARLGGTWGNVLQAGLFTLQPAHTTQGLLPVIQIFLFGLAAGWVVQRKGSIWSAIAAHGVANALVPVLSTWV